MIENVKVVSNPLTVIAIFAALAEIAGTVALATVDISLQHTFVWFVMAFPTCLVFLFFATLNFNTKVLYAPSDFKDEENFLDTLAGGRVISASLQDLTRQVELAQETILSQTTQAIGSSDDLKRERVVEVVNQQLELLKDKVESVRESAIEAQILEHLLTMVRPSSATDISKAIGWSPSEIEAAILKLAARKLVIVRLGVDNRSRVQHA